MSNVYANKSNILIKISTVRSEIKIFEVQNFSRKKDERMCKENKDQLFYYALILKAMIISEKSTHMFFLLNVFYMLEVWLCIILHTVIVYFKVRQSVDSRKIHLRIFCRLSYYSLNYLRL